MKILDVHTHFSIETTAISADADRIGYAVEIKSAAEHIDAMDRLGITNALLTCPTQRHLEDPAACAAYCRQVNEAGAQIVRNYPDRFVFAAALPLPYAEAAAEELRYAVRTLGAKAVGLCSNYNGVYLGDAALEAVWTAIEELGVPVFLHPAAPLDYPKGPVTGKILPMYEFITDTTRTLLDMFAAKTLNRHPGLKVVVPHSGSCLPVALDRYYGIMRGMGGCEEVPLEQLYFDVACDAYPRAVPILLNLTDASHILYGTDYPAIPEPVLVRHMEATKTCPSFKDSLENVLWHNGAALLNL